MTAEHPYYASLAEHAALVAQIAELQERERALRASLFNGTFPQPTEGTNKLVLPDGRTVKGEYKINRNLVESAWAQLGARELGILIDSGAFKHKAALVLPKYRDLEPAVRVLADTVLEIKPGLPTFEVVVPKPKEVRL
jgi:hypothetical protein